MLLHQLREHGVLGLQSLFEMRDAALGLEIGPLRSRAGAPLERGGALLKELLEPAMEDGGLEPGLVAELRHGHLLDQVPPQ